MCVCKREHVYLLGCFLCLQSNAVGVCVCVCVSACVRVCVRMCVRVYESERVRVRVSVFEHVNFLGSSCVFNLIQCIWVYMYMSERQSEI